MKDIAQTIILFEVRRTKDERGTLGEVLGYCDSMESAEARAKGEGWWGGTGAISAASGLVIGEQVWALRQREPIKVLSLEDVRVLKPIPQSEIDSGLRQAALAKLSPDEQRALGLA